MQNCWHVADCKKKEGRLNAKVGWWWADPLAALVMIPIIVKEGIEALCGVACDDCH